MKNLFLLVLTASALSLFGCHRSQDNNVSPIDNGGGVSDSALLAGFVHVIALPQYQDMQVKATSLNNSVIQLNSSPTADNLNAARQAWRDVRAAWESCEGFLFGPVEDNNYDPAIDTWPVDYLQLDSLIANSNTFTVQMVAGYNTTLRGFHPLEFILWGKNGNVSVDSISAIQKQYMLALSQDILNTADSLNASWAATGGNFQQQVLLAGKGATRFSSRQDALLAIVSSMADICNEVGRQSTGGKIYDPFSAYDSTKTESPFSHNSMTDFINNIRGAQNVYLCAYNNQQGVGISNLVAAHNLSLDNKIKQQFTAAINALGSVNTTFESAIHSQRTQLQSAMAALNTLQGTLDSELKTYIQTYVKD